MKINIVIPSTVLGGGLRVIFTYANYMTQNGHDVVAYVPGIYKWKDIPKVNIRTSIGNSIVRRNKMSWFQANFKIKVVPQITNQFIRDADITIATAWFTARNVFDLDKSKGEKVYFIQGYEINEQNSNKAELDETFRLSMHRVVIAKWLDKIVFNISHEHAHIIYNGTADNEFFYGEKKINHPRTIIMLGNKAEHKGWKPGIEVLKKVKSNYNCRIILYGARPIEDLPEDFEFYILPSRDKLMQLYTEADICLFPSIREGWGLIVTEAMAHQCAIVGNNTGVITEIGQDNVNALISKEKTSEALYSRLEFLMNDDCLLRKLQNASLETANLYRESTQCKEFMNYLIEINENNYEME